MNAVPEALLQVFVSSAVIWAATLAFKRIFRNRLSPKAHVAIWAVLIIRLMLPVTFDTGLHLVQVPVSEPEEVLAPETEIPATPQNELSPAASAIRPVITEHAQPQASVTRSVPVGQTTEVPGTLTIDLSDVLLSVWLGGAAVFAAVALRAYRRLRKDVDERMRDTGDPMHLLFQDCMREMGIRKRTFLAVQSELAGPALMYPNIVLVAEDMQYMPSEAVRMALRHELTHFVRGDHIKAMLLSILRIVWWWNPVIWLAVREIREDLETACDSEVVGRLSKTGRTEYAKTVLAMFGKTETNQAVLGMAFGGARKNAERRIRGIYMKPTSKRSVKAAAVLLAAVLTVACFTTACQPTPVAEAVVNQNEGSLEDALIGDSSTPNPEATTAPAAQYTASEHWRETIHKSDKFVINADVDVLTPDVSAYPVEKLAVRDLTQELVDELVDYFAPGVEFYQMNHETTKAELEEAIQDMEMVLKNDRERGDEEAVSYDEEALEELQEQYRNAPDQPERRPAAAEFTYATDYEGRVLEEEGPVHIDVAADSARGGELQISARRKSDTDTTQMAYFIFNDGVSYITEEQDYRNQDGLQTERSSVESLEEPMRSEELERLDKLDASITAHLPLYAQNPISLSAARQKGEQLLEQLGIRGAQIFTVEKALIGPALSDGTEQLTEAAVYMTFERENGGIPCVTPLGQNGIPDMNKTLYSAPFMPESGIIIVDQNLDVCVFQWDNPTQILEIVAPDCELIPLEEAKERLTEELYRSEMLVSSEYIEEFGLAYDIEEMKLVMGYVDVKNEPDNALAVPAWFVTAQGRQLEPEEGTGATILYNRQELMVNALDGSPILMPGTMQSYHGSAEGYAEAYS